MDMTLRLWVGGGSIPSAESDLLLVDGTQLLLEDDTDLLLVEGN